MKNAFSHQKKLQMGGLFFGVPRTYDRDCTSIPTFHTVAPVTAYDFLLWYCHRLSNTQVHTRSRHSVNTALIVNECSRGVTARPSMIDSAIVTVGRTSVFSRERCTAVTGDHGLVS